MKAKNGVPVVVVMKTESRQFEDINQHLFEDEGRFVEMNGSYYIRFEEEYQHTKVPVMVKITDDKRVNLIRYGEHKTNLLFDGNEPTYTKLNTPAGIAQITVDTNHLNIAIKDQPLSGEIFIQYELEMNQQKLGSYQIELRFTT